MNASCLLKLVELHDKHFYDIPFEIVMKNFEIWCKEKEGVNILLLKDELVLRYFKKYYWLHGAIKED